MMQNSESGSDFHFSESSSDSGIKDWKKKLKTNNIQGSNLQWIKISLNYLELSSSGSEKIFLKKNLLYLQQIYR